MEALTCPMCKSLMLIIYGCGWDYDKYACAARDCRFEIELDETTYPPDKVDPVNG